MSSVCRRPCCRSWVCTGACPAHCTFEYKPAKSTASAAARTASALCLGNLQLRTASVSFVKAPSASAEWCSRRAGHHTASCVMPAARRAPSHALSAYYQRPNSTQRQPSCQRLVANPAPGRSGPIPLDSLSEQCLEPFSWVCTCTRALHFNLNGHSRKTREKGLLKGQVQAR